jgi:Mrp family chromosome partitioning ATPase/capsular polysaccharide biosynthesis protein
LEPHGATIGTRIAALRPYRMTIVVSVVVTVLSAFAYSSRAGHTYTASSRVVVRPVLIGGTLTPQDLFEAAGDPFGLSALVDTQVELVLDQNVSDRVADILPRSIIGETSVAAKAITNDVLQISATGRDPRSAIRTANAYATAFLEERRDLVREALLVAVEDLDAKIAALTVDTEELSAEIADSPSTEPPVDLRAQLSSASTALATLTTRREQLALDAEAVSGGGGVVQRAIAASASGPAPLRDAAVGAFLGLGLGLGIALTRSTTDRRVFTLEAAAEATGADVLAVIPESRISKRKRRGDVPIRLLEGGPPNPTTNGATARSTSAAGAELRLPAAVAASLSMLRESLVARGLGSRSRRLVLLSAEPDQGSELATAGIAWACARAGFRTIAIDGALGMSERTPLFGTRAHDGLGQVLTGTTDAADALLATSVPGLSFLSAGAPRHGHDDALAPVRPSALLDKFGQHADLLLVRSCALSSGSDALAWSAAADSILLVLRLGGTMQGATRSSNLLRSLGLPLLGVVLMGANARHATVGVSRSVRSVGFEDHPDGNDPEPLSRVARSSPFAASPDGIDPKQAPAGSRRRR